LKIGTSLENADVFSASLQICLPMFQEKQKFESVPDRALE